MSGADAPRTAPWSARTLAGLAALHLLLALVYTWPLAREWDRAVPGLPRAEGSREAGDSVQCLWNVWWFHRSAARGHSPFECPEMGHPQGVHLYFNASTLLNGALAAPLVGPLGLVRATNAMVLLNLVLAGLAASGLGWQVTRSRAGALLAGLAFGPAPFVFGRWLGHWHLACTAPLALGAWLLVRLAQRPGRRGALGLGAGLALAGYAEPTYLLFLLLLAAAMAGTAVVRRGPAGQRPGEFLGALTASGAVLCVLLAPVLLGAWHELGTGGASVVERTRYPLFSADLLEYLVPNSAHPLWRDRDWFYRLTLLVPGMGADARRPWPGLMVLGLAVAGLLYGRDRDGRRLHWWGAVALGALWLSMGGTLRVAGRDLLPPAYELLDALPVLGYVRGPGRYSALVQLALAVLAGAGAPLLTRRAGRRALAAVSAVLIFEFLPAPIPLYSLQVPGAVRTLARQPEPGAVLELRVQPIEARLYQVVHGRPTVGAYSSRSWERDVYPARALGLLLQRAAGGEPVAERLLRDLLEAWQVRFVLAAPETGERVRDFLSGAAWIEGRSGEDGWLLLAVRAQAPAERARLDQRLTAALGPGRPALEHAVLLGLHALEPAGPAPEWNAGAERLRAQRLWWRRWARQRQRTAAEPGGRARAPGA